MPMRKKALASGNQGSQMMCEQVVGLMCCHLTNLQAAVLPRSLMALAT